MLHINVSVDEKGLNSLIRRIIRWWGCSGCVTKLFTSYQPSISASETNLTSRKTFKNRNI